MVSFALTTAYMLGAAGYCVYQAVQQSSESLIMAQIVVSLVSTCPSSSPMSPPPHENSDYFILIADGCYVLSSLIAGDPWVRFLSSMRRCGRSFD